MKDYKGYDFDYLADHYRKATKQVMERGFGKEMALGFYKCALESNSKLEKPKDLGDLEMLVIRYSLL